MRSVPRTKYPKQKRTRKQGKGVFTKAELRFFEEFGKIRGNPDQRRYIRIYQLGTDHRTRKKKIY